MRVLLLLAATLTVALALSACQNDVTSDPEKYRRAHDRYMDTYEPKTGSHL
jgi:ABC-type oligopeptide transport system substrate-binding subunit